MSDAHERWSEDLAAYLLGALEGERVPEFERHLVDCERCRSEMRWLTVAVEALPEAVEPRQPPLRLRESLMAEVHADPEAASAGAESSAAALGRRFDAWRRGSGARLWRPLAGAAALVLVVAAVAGYMIGNDSGTGGASTVESRSSGITAQVVSEDGRGEIRLADVQQLPPDRVLEAWVQRDGEVEPVKALFVPDPDGNATTELGSMRGVEVVMVTTEPPGGSAAPTSTPIATVPLTQ
jgi:anti-sigma-K factor RskA